MSAARALRRLWTGPLDTPPRPLLDPASGLLVLWSAKAACSITFVWFAAVTGLLDELRRSGKSPHRFRMEDYYGSELHRAGTARPLGSCFVLQVFRDPFERAVSSYRQALKTGTLDKPRSPIDSRAGFSFADFLSHLETVDLSDCNIHHRLQTHPVGTAKRPDRIINISRQDLFENLNACAAGLGLPPTDFAALGRLAAREARRRAHTATHDATDVSALRFETRAAQSGRPWPEYDQFLTAATRARIARLYAPDLAFFAGHL